LISPSPGTQGLSGQGIPIQPYAELAGKGVVAEARQAAKLLKGCADGLAIEIARTASLLSNHVASFNSC
jgi:hypothetical protein